MVLIPLIEISFSPLAHDVNSLTYPILHVHGPIVVSLFHFFSCQLHIVYYSPWEVFTSRPTGLN